MSYKTGPVTWHKTWLGWGMPPLHFLFSNEKKGKEKKERVFKAETIKSLSTSHSGASRI